MATVLIVEDDPSVARLLELMLGVEGLDPEIVRDGTAARTRLAGEPADLVVLDVMLPGVDGVTLLRELRQIPRWAATKVIVLSALDHDDDVWEGWSSGADHYLSKPFDVGQLRDVADRLLAGEELTQVPPRRATSASG